MLHENPNVKAMPQALPSTHLALPRAVGGPAMELARLPSLMWRGSEAGHSEGSLCQARLH